MVVGFWTQTFTDCTWRGPEDPLSVSILLSSSPEINPYSNFTMLINEWRCTSENAANLQGPDWWWLHRCLHGISQCLLSAYHLYNPKAYTWKKNPDTCYTLQGNFCHAEDNATPHRTRIATLSTATWNRQNATVGKVAWLQPPGTGLVHAVNMMQTLLRTLMSISI